MGFGDWLSDAFSTNGSVTTFFEKIPVVGHITGVVQFATGNTDQGWRAIAESTGNLLSVAGAVVGAVGGPAGAAAGGAAGGAIGTLIKHGIGTQIDNPDVKRDIGDLTVTGVLTGTVVSGATAFIPGGGQMLGNVGKGLISTTGKQMVLSGIGNVVGTTMLQKPLGDMIEPKPDDPLTKKERLVVSQYQEGEARELGEKLVEVANAYDTQSASHYLRNFAQGLMNIQAGNPFAAARVIWLTLMIAYTSRNLTAAEIASELQPKMKWTNAQRDAERVKIDQSLQRIGDKIQNVNAAMVEEYATLQPN